MDTSTNAGVFGMGVVTLVASTVQGARHRRRTLRVRGWTACHYSSSSSLSQSAPVRQHEVPLFRPRLPGLQGSLWDGVNSAVDLLRRSRPQPISVVDCGSGSTRGIHFTEVPNLEGRPEVRKTKSDWRGDPLALALQDEARLAGLVDLLAQQLPSGLVLVGATAGVRGALDAGVLTERHLEAFSRNLRDAFGDRARFDVLSGLDEATAEWGAVLHELSARPRPALADCAGMLSGGGMSCQLVARGRAGPRAEAFSFENSVLVPGGLVDRAAKGLLTAPELHRRLQALRATVSERIAPLPRGLRGSFALIEWVGFFVAGEPSARDLPMCLGYERLLDRRTVLEALDKHLQALRPVQASTPVPRAVTVALVYGTVIRAMVGELFHETATFYCLGGVSWAMGHYLQSRRAACFF